MLILGTDLCMLCLALPVRDCLARVIGVRCDGTRAGGCEATARPESILGLKPDNFLIFLDTGFDGSAWGW